MDDGAERCVDFVGGEPLGDLPSQPVNNRWNMPKLLASALMEKASIERIAAQAVHTSLHTFEPQFPGTASAITLLLRNKLCPR